MKVMKVFDMKIYNFRTAFAINEVLVMLCAQWECVANKRVLLSKGLLLSSLLSTGSDCTNKFCLEDCIDSGHQKVYRRKRIAVQ